MAFAIVSGLSMDYGVFLISRVHEEWQRRGDASAAVREGLAHTGRVISAAAAVMVAVFGAFALSGSRVLELFGQRTGAFPRGLDRRLPRLAIEPQADRHRAPAPSPAFEGAL